MNVLQLLIDFGLFLLIWIVQLIIYPSFTYMEEANFQQWHPPYTQAVSYFVMPLMLGQVALLAYLIWNDFDWIYIIQAILVGLVWANTFFVAVPLHNEMLELSSTMDLRTKLVQINWWRTGMWTIVFLLSVYKFFHAKGLE